MEGIEQGKAGIPDAKSTAGTWGAKLGRVRIFEVWEDGQRRECFWASDWDQSQELSPC